MTKQRVSRKEQRRRELAAQRRKRALLIGVPVGVIIASFIGLILYRVFEPEIEGIANFGALLRNHDTSATFADAQLPPTGGSHNPRWQNCGIYDAPIDNSLAVHSLEHGAVWLAYRSDLPAEQVEALRDQVRRQGDVLMSPYPGLESDVVMSAWSTQLQIDSLPDERIESFINRYRNQGPESASCSGGVGAPIN